MAALLSRRWRTFLLLAGLVLVKLALPPGPSRFALFYGGGVALAALAVWQEGDNDRVRPLLGRPLQGLLGALAGYGALLAAAALVLQWKTPWQPLLPDVLYDLAAQFDPFPLYLALKGGAPLPTPGMVALTGAGALAEEWIFRVALFWRWLPAEQAAAPPRGWPGLGAVPRLLAVSAYFAALHWPQLELMPIALLGGFVLGAVLLWRRNFTLVAALHVLFNWHMLL